jgi:hypothetical protein
VRGRRNAQVCVPHVPYFRFILSESERECNSGFDHILFFPLGGMDGGVTLLGEVHLLLHYLDKNEA